MWLMLQHDEPDDFVIATGRTHAIRDLLELAFNQVGLRWQEFVEIDPRYQRPAEVDLLLGDASKAAAVLGWRAETTFEQLIELMIAADWRLARRERWIEQQPAAA
jgi:GDP-D-mannose dehydratase